MESSVESGGSVSLQLSADEALVLFEWIHRIEDENTDLRSAGVVDEAERIVLWDVSASLESHLVEPFREDYAELVQEARTRLRAPLADD